MTTSTPAQIVRRHRERPIGNYLTTHEAKAEGEEIDRPERKRIGIDAPFVGDEELHRRRTAPESHTAFEAKAGLRAAVLRAIDAHETQIAREQRADMGPDLHIAA